MEISLEMPSIRIEIFTKCLSFSENISKMPSILKNKKPHILKKEASRQLPHCQNGHSTPVCVFEGWI
jgi:hypothetical protein